MGLLDIILGGFLCYGMYRGFKNGFFIEFASLISLVLGIFMAIKFSAFTSGFLYNQFGWTSRFVPIIAFALTFLIVVLGIRIIAKIFTNLAAVAMLGWLNRIGGALFSVVKTILILSIVINLFTKININNVLVKKETIDKSLFFNPVLELSDYVYPGLAKLFVTLKEQTKDLYKEE